MKSLGTFLDTRFRSVLILMQISLLLGSLLLLSGCGGKPQETGENQTPTLRPPQVAVTQPPAAIGSANKFLDLWKTSEYESMYAMLSGDARAAVTLEQFSQAYENAANELLISELQLDIVSDQVKPESATVRVNAAIESGILGPLERSFEQAWILEQGEWRLIWDPGLVIPELAGGNRLGFDRQWSGRGAIFDRQGNPLAAQTDAVAVGVWPDYVDLKELGGLTSLLASVSPYRSITIAGMIENANPGDYIPIAEIPKEGNERVINQLSSWGSVVVAEYSRRLYYGSGTAAHVVGYVSAIQEDELSSYMRRGYLADDRVGRKGIEQWGEDILMGKPGGTVYLFNPEGKPVEQLGSAPNVPGRDIYLTIDRDFQVEVQKALSIFKGAIVVLERDTGRVIAMASSPGYDPNAFEIENYNWDTLLAEIANDEDLPQFNRAAQGQYPLGSVFKIITMATALESGRYNQDSTYDCGYTFDELGGITLYDWTWEHFQEDEETKPSGLLTLPQGLIKSCNPWFYHIGNDLYNAGLTTLNSEMARGFGLGSKTGIVGIDEETGNVPDPASPLDATNLAIGQGDLLVTPLQVARFIAAVGNGGTLYRPQVIEKIESLNGSFESLLSPEIQGTLPLTAGNLTLIQEAMKGVVSSKKPEGTAYRELSGLRINIAGKTGTATSSGIEPHAWFAGYTFENREDLPDIAVVVIAENAGEGSEIAAPIFRRVLELYFFGQAQRLYEWEATFDVTRSPTPDVTEEPKATRQPNINP